MLQPHHHKVVSDLVQILSRTVYCRAQHQALLSLLRQLKPPTKGTPEFIAKQQKSKDVFQCALWAPPPQPQQAKQSVAGKRPAAGQGGAPWGAPAQWQRTALPSKAASPAAAAAAASAASHPVGGSTAPLPEAARGHRVTPTTAAAPGPPPPPGLPPPRPHQSGHLGPPPRPPHPPCPPDAAAATLHPATAIMCAVKRQKPSPPALPPPFHRPNRCRQLISTRNWEVAPTQLAGGASCMASCADRATFIPPVDIITPRMQRRHACGLRRRGAEALLPWCPRCAEQGVDLKPGRTSRTADGRSLSYCFMRQQYALTTLVFLINTLSAHVSSTTRFHQTTTSYYSVASRV